jgi:hypothetical protein
MSEKVEEKKDEKEEFKIIKVIVKNIKFSLFKFVFGLEQGIDNIYFDTYGQYSFLKEAQLTSDWKVEYEYNAFTYMLISNKNYNFTFISTNYYWKEIEFQDKNKKVLARLRCVKSQKVYQVEFLQSVFSYDDIIFIMDKVIRCLHTRMNQNGYFLINSMDFI